jgi:thioredoxin-dependent peroxiredoxin
MIRLTRLAASLLVVCLAGMEPVSVDVGKRAPDFALLNAESMTVRLSAYRDRQPVVLVFARAQWCRHSLDHMRALQGKYADFKQAGAEVIAVFREDSGRLDGLKVVREASQAEFVLLTDYEAQRTTVYSPDAYTAYVINRRGIVSAVVSGTQAQRPDVAKLLEAVKLLAAK